MKISFGITIVTFANMALAFVPSSPRIFGVSHISATIEDITIDVIKAEEQQVLISSPVRAPLKYLGPYPCLSFQFPNLATKSQRERNVTGISLDFILDTAANLNTINAQVASELGLEKVGEAPGGFDVGGTMQGGDTFFLGDCELEGLMVDESFVFMKGLTASALPSVASPASAGLLSLAFLNCFPGGVEFQWGKVENGTVTESPSVAFCGEDNLDPDFSTMSRAIIKPLPVTLLPSITVEINGVRMPALLDTGAPITVLNAQAAAIAGVKTVVDAETLLQRSNNPFSNFANNAKMAQAVAKGDVLQVGGGPNGIIPLLKSEEKVNVAIVAAGEDDNTPISFGHGNLFVGNLPGLAALDGIGDDAPPAVVLGMDVLRTKSKMLYRGQQNEIFFEN